MQAVVDTCWFSSQGSRSDVKLNIFFFPYAGGGALAYRSWLQCLPVGVRGYLTHLPGREQRLHEAPFYHIEPLIQELSRAVVPFLATPFVFFGHSMGALIAFELARELRRKNLPQPLCLFVSACAAPQIKDWHPPIHALSDSALLEQIHSYAKLPNEILFQKELIQTVLPLLRADFALCENYRYLPGEPLACPISAFGGIEDNYITYEGLGAWRTQTSTSFTMRMFPGDHFFLQDAKEYLLRMLCEDIASVIA